MQQKGKHVSAKNHSQIGKKRKKRLKLEVILKKDHMLPSTKDSLHLQNPISFSKLGVANNGREYLYKYHT